MDPNNAEYRQALNYMESGGQTAYQQGGTFGTDCDSGLCGKLCCAYVLCNSFGYGGFRFCCI